MNWKLKAEHANFQGFCNVLNNPRGRISRINPPRNSRYVRICQQILSEINVAGVPGSTGNSS